MQATMIGGIPARMARAVAAIFARDGQGAHARKVEVLAALDADFDRIPLADGAGAQTTIMEIVNAAERAARACYAMCASIQTADGIAIAIAGECARRGVAYPAGVDLAERIKRVTDAAWWRRVLRKEYARRFEHTAIQIGLVGVRTDPYVTRETAIMQELQNRANQKLLESRTATNDQGQSYTVAELAALGVGNKTIRRGELMTRIRGLEEIAKELGHVGMFWTITCPSKFHSVGGTNENYKGATPRDAQKYLVGVWAKMRSAMKRIGMQPYGFRIAEPHTDGCPHWHMLFFVDPVRQVEMSKIITAYALAEDGDEKGALENRVKLVTIEAGKGSAAGYILKYVCKNIDGAGVGDHKVFEDGRTYIVAPDIFGDLEITPSARVTYWSQVWGIRQFQQIGGAPVGVWRELRRIKEETVRQAPPAIRAAHAACQKIGDEQASFAKYVMAQGGPTVGRGAAIKIAAKEVVIVGKYAIYEASAPVGVYLVAQPNAVYESVRYTWTIAATGAALAVPRTGVNNCTDRAKKTTPWPTKPKGKTAWMRPAADQVWKDHAKTQKKFFSDVRTVRKENKGGKYRRGQTWSMAGDAARDAQYEAHRVGGASFDEQHLQYLRKKEAMKNA